MLKVDVLVRFYISTNCVVSLPQFFAFIFLRQLFISLSSLWDSFLYFVAVYYIVLMSTGLLSAVFRGCSQFYNSPFLKTLRSRSFLHILNFLSGNKGSCHSAASSLSMTNHPVYWEKAFFLALIFNFSERLTNGCSRLLRRTSSLRPYTHQSVLWKCIKSWCLHHCSKQIALLFS